MILLELQSFHSSLECPLAEHWKQRQHCHGCKDENGLEGDVATRCGQFVESRAGSNEEEGGRSNA